MPKQHSYSNKQEAEAERDRWKKELPPVDSAYKPSGKLPASAKGVMTAGAVLGVPAGLISGVIVAAIGGLLAALSAWVFIAIQENCKVYWCGPIVLLFIVAVATFFAMYAAIGIASSMIVVRMGKLGKNRNVAFTTLLSVVSAFLAALTFWFLARYVSQLIGETSSEPTTVQSQVWALLNTFVRDAVPIVFGTSTFGWVCTIVGFATAIIAAMSFASTKVLETKFCENCELFMDQWKPKPMSFSGAKDMIKDFETGKIGEAASVLNTNSDDEGRAALFACPECGVGYLDLKMNFSAQWPGRTDSTGTQTSENLSDSWLVVSRSLTPDEVEIFKRSDEEKLSPGCVQEEK